MIKKLDWYESRAIEPLISMDNQLDFDTIDPSKVCDSQFWCPFQSYQEVEFEEIVTKQYKGVSC